MCADRGREEDSLGCGLYMPVSLHASMGMNFHLPYCHDERNSLP